MCLAPLAVNDPPTEEGKVKMIMGLLKKFMGVKVSTSLVGLCLSCTCEGGELTSSSGFSGHRQPVSYWARQRECKPELIEVLDYCSRLSLPASLM